MKNNKPLGPILALLTSCTRMNFENKAAWLLHLKTLNIKKVRHQLCRSLSAEAVFRQKSQALSLIIDSAWIVGSHARKKPDHRAQKVGITRGYLFDKIKARKVTEQDFENFDLILAMNNKNVQYLMKVASEGFQYKVQLFLDYAENFEDQESSY
jgi:protein-tyrosine-phosphatase